MRHAARRGPSSSGRTDLRPSAVSHARPRSLRGAANEGHCGHPGSPREHAPPKEGVGLRKLYHTEEEKRAAKKARNARYLAAHRAELAAIKKRWRQANPEEAKRRSRESYIRNREHRLLYAKRHQAKSVARNREKRAGMSPELFAARLVEQGNCCAICRTSVNESSHADHDHDTMRPRGVLCYRCNIGLGCFSDRISLVERAAAYLRSWDER